MGLTSTVQLPAFSGQVVRPLQADIDDPFAAEWSARSWILTVAVFPVSNWSPWPGAERQRFAGCDILVRVHPSLIRHFSPGKL